MIKKFIGSLLLGLVSCVCSAQTVRNFPSLETDNTFKGSNLFPRINGSYVFGTGLYPSIQATVTAACTSSAETRVVLLPASNPPDTVGSVTGGCTTAPLEDQRSFPSACYTWNGSAYSVGDCSSGASHPAGSDEDVQFGISGAFAADTGRFVYNPTTHFLSSNLNGVFNVDRYQTGAGNNGIANLFSADCTSGCTAVVPAISTATDELGATLPDNLVFKDGRSATRGTTYHNCLAQTSGAGSRAYCNTTNVLWDKFSGLGLGGLVRNFTLGYQGGFSWGNSVTGSGNSGWSGGVALIDTALFNTRGITQLHSATVVKHGTGDISGDYMTSFSDGGTSAGSDEGVNIVTREGGETSTWFHGTVATGATTGTTLLPATYVSGAQSTNVTTDGSFMLDISQGSVSGHITGFEALVSGTGVWSLPVDTTLTPSTQWGLVNTALNGAPAGHSETVDITLKGGSDTQFRTGTACLAGYNFPEQVAITAVGTPTSGHQSVTLFHRNPDVVSSGGQQSSLWQGGPCGQYISVDKNLARDGFRTSYPVVGAVDTSHLAYVWQNTGAIGADKINAWRIPTNLISVTRNGSNIVTVTAGPGLLTSDYSYQPTLVIAGASDPTFNGNCTNSTPNFATSDTGVQSISCTLAGSAGTASGSMTLRFPPSFFGFHLYPGAEVIGPQIGNSVPLETNSVAWTTGDTLENPHYPSFSMTGERFVIVQNTLPSGRLSGMRQVDYFGSGISFGFRPDFQTNGNPCNLYVGCGGSLEAPQWRLLTGAYSTYLHLTYSPLGHTPEEGGSLFTVGPSFNGDHHPYYIFDLENGYMKYSPAAGNFIVSGINVQNLVTKNEVLAVGGLAISAGQGGSGLRFTMKDNVTTIGNIQPENFFIAGTNLGVGILDGSTRGSFPLYSARGGWDTGKLTSSSTALLNGLSAGIIPPVEVPGLSYSGTPGTTAYSYAFTAVTPNGQETPIGNGTNIGASTLGGGNTITITCSLAIQNGWPTGTTVNVYRMSAPVSLLGNCPYGGTVTDDGSVTAITLPPSYNATSSPIVGGLLLGLNASLSALPSSTTTTPDVYFGRGASGTWYFGTTKGGHDATIRAGTGTFDTALTSQGSAVCTVAAPCGTRGRATLVAGTVIVSTSTASSTANYQLTNCGLGGTQGLLSVGTVVPGTSFVINSSSSTDTSVVCWSLQ